MGWQTFKAYVEGASAGDIEIKIFPAGQLGSHKEILEQVKAGVLQVGQGDEAVPGEFFRPMDLLAAPFLFNNEQEALRFFDGSFFGGVADDMAKRTGLRILSVAPLGFRNFTNNVKPIKSVADMSGLKIRVQPNPLYLNMIKAMGASPTPIPWVELYGALQQKVVDGQENPTGIILDYKFYEVQKHLTVDEHALAINMIIVGEGFYQKLPPHLKVIMLEGARSGRDVEYALRNYQARVTATGELQKKGMQVYFPTPEEKASFRKAANDPVRAWLVERLGQDFVTKAFAAIEKARKDISAEAMRVAN
jgi:C4-dicarboxylate-binding protein DctP